MCLINYFDYVKSLGYSQVPNYNHILNLFYDEYKSQSIPDWKMDERNITIKKNPIDRRKSEIPAENKKKILEAFSKVYYFLLIFLL